MTNVFLGEWGPQVYGAGDESYCNGACNEAN